MKVVAIPKRIRVLLVCLVLVTCLLPFGAALPARAAASGVTVAYSNKHIGYVARPAGEVDRSTPSGFYPAEGSERAQRASNAPLPYQVTSFFTTTKDAKRTADATHKPLVRTGIFPKGTKEIGYSISAYGKLDHISYQVEVVMRGRGVLYTTDPDLLLPANIQFKASHNIKVSTFDTIVVTPAYPSGIYQFVLLLAGRPMAATTFLVG